MLFAFSTSVLAEPTNFQKVAKIQFDGDSGHLYFVGESKWVSENCPSATYVMVRNSVAGRKEIMSIGLSAKMSGTNVSFWGDCSPVNDNYFYAHYIVIQ